MLITPSLIALYALAGLFAIFLWARVFTFPRGKRRQAVHIAATFVVLMGVIVVVFSVMVPWLISLILGVKSIDTLGILWYPIQGWSGVNITA